jgi:hypothetical protein
VAGQKVFAHRVPSLLHPCLVQTYPEIIKNPMDLGTVKKRLQEHRYHESREAIGELNLVWYNCMRFNPVFNVSWQGMELIFSTFGATLPYVLLPFSSFLFYAFFSLLAMMSICRPSLTRRMVIRQYTFF